MMRAKFSFVLVATVVQILQTNFSGADNFTLGKDAGNPFDCGQYASGNIFCDGYASTSSSDLEFSPPSEPVNGTFGRALKINEPLLLLNTTTGRWDSFRTSFQFRIQPNVYPGDGMTFVLLNMTQHPGKGASHLGVYGDSGRAINVATLAIEFDTHQNVDNGDIDGNHVGVDLDNIMSKTARSAWDVGINMSASTERLYAWIDYDSSQQNLEVRISRNNSRPVESFLQTQVDFSDVFGQNPQVHIGFTASNGGSVSNYYIYYWKFEHFPTYPGEAPEFPPPSASLPSGSKNESGKRTGMLVGVTIGVVFLLILFGFYLTFAWLMKRRPGGREITGLDGISVDNLRFSYKELSAATGHFREEAKLGQGGFGSVYRGVIPSTGVQMAVKKVSQDSKQGLQEFVAEVTIISELRHRNIVRLLGWCMHQPKKNCFFSLRSEKNKFLLVYEFMANGSLDKALFHPAHAAGSVLTWKQRFHIILGAAEALHYLHEGCRQQIIHRDFKSSNIMLDAEFNAMLGDFGLARMIDRQDDPATTMILAGTFGYIAPEVPFSRKFTEKTDVYAFGAVALEVACGRKAYSFALPEEERLLVDWVWKKLEEDNLMSVVDPRLEGVYSAQQVQMLLFLGLLCSHPNPDDRPSIRHVLEVLAGHAAMPPVPLSKPTPEYPSVGRQFHVETSHLASATDTLSGSRDMKLTDGSIPIIVNTPWESDPFVHFSNSSAEPVVSSKDASDPLIGR